MRLICYILSLILFVPFFSYSQNLDKEKNNVIKKLTGKWDWISSHGGFGDHTSTPEIMGFTKSYIFFQDSEDLITDSMSVLVYRNDTLIETRKTNLKIEHRKEYGWSCLLPFAGNQNWPGQWILNIEFSGDDKVELWPYGNDVFNHIYEKDLSYQVNIYDINLLSALIEQGIDLNDDGLITFYEAQQVSCLDVSSKQITCMSGIEAFRNLQELNCSNNLISVLDLSINHNLTRLNCSGNKLNNFAASFYFSPGWMDFSNNPIATLELPAKPKKSESGGYSIKLTDMPNLTNVCLWDSITSGITVEASNNPNVYFTTGCAYKIISFPDTAFFNALIEEGVDKNGDSLINNYEAALRLSLSVKNKGINNMFGIESFVNLTNLYCDNNDFTSLDVSGLLNLERLNCEHCDRLTYLDASGCSSLSRLFCGWNSLEGINLSGAINLELLDCSYNKITNLDLSDKLHLKQLSCSNNQIEFLDISDCNSINYIYCYANRISTIDLINCPLLRNLNCADNNLLSLNVSINTLLNRLICSNNNLTNLDLQSNINLKALYVRNNKDLSEVCVWTESFQGEGFELDTIGCPNVFFTSSCSHTGIIQNDLLSPSIYPNPVIDKLRIEYEDYHGFVTEITTLSGQLLYRKNTFTNFQEIDFYSFMDGIYLVLIRSGNNYFIQKIIKH